MFTRALGQAVKGIVVKGGMPGLTTMEEAEKLEKDLVDEIAEKDAISAMQLVWVSGRKPE